MHAAFSCTTSSNTLDAHQRAQLTRSIHKLSKILGTTPQLVQEIPSSLEPRRSLSGNTRRPKPAPLLLRHHSISTSLPPTPTTTTPRASSAKAARRRTVAKLSRTFGESVPTELVVTPMVERKLSSSGNSVIESVDDDESHHWRHSIDTLTSLVGGTVSQL